jgi:hypothetical protein
MPLPKKLKIKKRKQLGRGGILPFKHFFYTFFGGAFCQKGKSTALKSA